MAGVQVFGAIPAEGGLPTNIYKDTIIQAFLSYWSMPHIAPYRGNL